MATYKEIDDILNDDFFKLHLEDRNNQITKTEDRDIINFLEINNFYSEYGREPRKGTGISPERNLYNKLLGIREDEKRIKKLIPFDEFNLLNYQQNINQKEKMEVAESIKPYDSLDDVFNGLSDILNLDTTDTLEKELRNTKRFEEYREKQKRSKAENISRAEKSSEFEKYENFFRQIHKDITEGNRKIEKINNSQDINKGDLFILKGVMLHIEKIGHNYKTKQDSLNAEMKVVYENGQINEKLKRNSLAAGLRRADSFRVSRHKNEILEQKLLNKNQSEKDLTTGYIYILKSLSNNKEIQSIKNLYKIGYTTGNLSKRLSNARNDSTYLYADISVVREYEIRNFNAQKLEKMLHHMLEDRKLNIEIPTPNGNYIKPKEWFIVSLEEVEKIIQEIVIKLHIELEK